MMLHPFLRGLLERRDDNGLTIDGRMSLVCMVADDIIDIEDIAMRLRNASFQVFT